MAPCFRGTGFETPEDFSHLSRFSMYHRKFLSKASLLEYFGAKPSALSALSMETTKTFKAAQKIL